jgi:hypothetical protein
MTGLVRDTSAFPIDSVEISLPALQRRAYTKSDGTFFFSDIKPGKYEVRARKIGYAPQVREFTVDTAGGTGLFMLLPLPYVLRPVVTTIARRGLSGVVGDTSFNALAGAEVHVLGKDAFVQTDSLGQFYIPINSGSYVVRVKQPGFADRLVSVIVPDDSGQRIHVMLEPSIRRPSIREFHNFDDLNSRLTWRSPAHTRVYTHAELVQRKIDWVYDAVMIGYHEIHSGQPGMLDKDCYAMVNGGPKITQIGRLTVEDIETVEIYVGSNGPAPRRGRQTPRQTKTTLDHVPITNTDSASWANSTRACATVYVWLR